MLTYKNYHSYLIKSLKDPLETATYLDVALQISYTIAFSITN